MVVDGYYLGLLSAYVILLGHYSVYNQEAPLADLMRSYLPVLDIQPDASSRLLSFWKKVEETLATKFADLTSSAKLVIAWDEDWPQGLIGVGLLARYDESGIGSALFSAIVSVSKGIGIPFFWYLLVFWKSRLLDSRLRALSLNLRVDWATAIGPQSSLSEEDLRKVVLEVIVGKMRNDEVERALHWYADQHFKIFEPVYTKALAMCDKRNAQELIEIGSSQNPPFVLLNDGVFLSRCRDVGMTSEKGKARDQTEEAVKANDETIKQLLAGGTIRLLSCAWLLSNPLTVIRRLQDLPEEAFLSTIVAVDAFRDGRVYVLSYGWIMTKHPDPEGFVLQRVLEFLSSSWASDVPNFAPLSFGLFWDFACLPQVPRSGEEETRFNAGLSAMSKLYGSLFNTSVIQVTSFPPGKEGYNRTPYNERVWCIAEDGIARTSAFYGSRSSSMPPKLIDISDTEPQTHVPSTAPSVDALQQKLDSASFTSGKNDKQKVMKQAKEFMTMRNLGSKVQSYTDVIGQPDFGLRV